MKIMKPFRSHVFQAAENRVNACEQSLRGIKKKSVITGNCQSNILHHQYIPKFSS